MDVPAASTLRRSPAPLPAALAEAAATRTLVMGIVNVTPDSFSDGGSWLDPSRAISRGRELLEQGADLLDIGGESTRPGASRVTAEEEWERIGQVVRTLAAEGAVVSVDTIHAATAARAIDVGALIINDVSGSLADPQMPGVIAQGGVVYVCQHWRGNPETMDQLTDYHGDVVGGVIAELRERLATLEAAGVQRHQVVVDPGLGFAKTHRQSWQLLAHTAQVGQALELPVLIGASRKRFLAAALGGDCENPASSSPCERDAATLATTALAAAAGAWAVRVHETAPHAQAVRAASLWKENQ